MLYDYLVIVYDDIDKEIYFFDSYIESRLFVSEMRKKYGSDNVLWYKSQELFYQGGNHEARKRN